eukprot:m.158199 g.158199  ORF g.158199 m.158199 type:complete len:201 (-) comp15130_c0_seq4:109-711(-)
MSTPKAKRRKTEKPVHRCGWAGEEPGMVKYHDEEWGVPSHDDKHLFEMLTLEGAQAGLCWATILKKREGYRKAFHNFDIQKVAKMSKASQTKLASNPDIIRNKLKISSTVDNAKAVIKVQKEFGSFSEYIWNFVDGKPIVNQWKSMKEMPVKTDIAIALSADLKERGFRFVGPTIMYVYMQVVTCCNFEFTSCLVTFIYH